MENKKLEIHQAIINKALEDTNFKNGLLSSPEETLTANGFKLINPDNFKFKVIDQTDPSKIFINIPAMTIGEDVELTDEQLEVVAGGAASECGGCNIYIEIQYDDMTVCIEKHT